jgi:predicted aspartyl protease
MIVGSVGAGGDALVRLSVVLPETGDTREVEAILDAGFNGSLALPRARVEPFGLTPTGEVPLTTASGATFATRTYEATVASPPPTAPRTPPPAPMPNPSKPAKR